jgi:DNA-binding LacI/PurR family transcriptional regulator
MLTQRQTMTIGVLTPQALAIAFSNPFFGLFGEGVAEAAEERGYGLHLISPLRGSLATALARATVDGVVAIGLSGEHREVGQIRSAGLPMVLVDSDDLPEHSSVTVDDEAGADAAAATQWRSASWPPPATSGSPCRSR